MRCFSWWFRDGLRSLLVLLVLLLILLLVLPVDCDKVRLYRVLVFEGYPHRSIDRKFCAYWRPRFNIKIPINLQSKSVWCAVELNFWVTHLIGDRPPIPGIDRSDRHYTLMISWSRNSKLKTYKCTRTSGAAFDESRFGWCIYTPDRLDYPRSAVLYCAPSREGWFQEKRAFDAKKSASG